MSLYPVIQRELRQEARRWTAACSRTVVSGCLVGVLVLLGGGGEAIRFGTGQGAEMFVEFMLFVFSLVWVLVPLVSCDTVSREQRERTLGLLFLTPLRAWEVLGAKTVVHLIRLSSWFTAAFPVFMIPVLLGGVTFLDVVRMVLLVGSALVLALLAGMAASVRYANRWQATAWALVYSMGLLGLLGAGYVLGSVVILTVQTSNGWDFDRFRLFAEYFYRAAWNRLPWNHAGWTWGIAPFQGGISAGSTSWAQVQQAVVVFLLSGIASLAGLWRFSRMLRSKVSHGDGALDRQGAVRQRRRLLCFWGANDDWVRYRMLARRHGVVSWAKGLCAGVVLVEAYWWFRFADAPAEFVIVGTQLVVVLAGLGGLRTASLLWRERESGVIELLSVTPMGVLRYAMTLLVVALLPVVMASGVAVMGIAWQAGSWVLPVALSALVGNTGCLAFLLAWGGRSVSMSGLVALVLTMLIPLRLFAVDPIDPDPSWMLLQVAGMVTLGLVVGFIWRLRGFRSGS